ncbi:FAD-dependent monooxygenase [Streptomyces sp.]|uniref:FAD-dependent monooxygenase n=1 Tax=Streptomyces sp. TaxID=1931 RepID=UPI002D773209|nr:FAD-dependent monooxygenase [Streptomyces sp.]HET6360098.1 FAD-dependent monooxygenase [Streptomyces sp.]
MAEPLDVLVVGAGPTGLALAAQLRAYGTRFRIIDRNLDRARESRALAIQPRTLEALAGFGVTDELVARGNRAVQVRMHVPGRVLRLPLFDIGCADTPYPYALFLSQAQTEAVLGAHLAERGVAVERGTVLRDLSPQDTYVTCRLSHGGEEREEVRARFVVGCDGAHSTVRGLAGIGFVGSTYPQTFLLADLEVDGLERGAAHAYLSEAGMLFFFPLESPATWRMLAMRPPDAPDEEVSLGQLQAITDRYADDSGSAAEAGEGLLLRDAVWMTEFRLQNRGAAHYRAGRVFLAGDAAHIHSPAGAQGMNTGIQDALNLGWKLALTCLGAAPEALLDTYESERAPVGRNVLRFTDRAFTIATSRNPFIRRARTQLAPRLMPLALRFTTLRGRAFRTLSELAIHYRHSPLTEEGNRRPRGGPRAGDRLPDAPAGLQALASGAGYHVLLCGPRDAWESQALTALGRSGLVTVHHLGDQGPWPGTAHGLVRPDGYLAYRARGTDLSGLRHHLDRWLPAPAPN